MGGFYRHGKCALGPSAVGQTPGVALFGPGWKRRACPGGRSTDGRRRRRFSPPALTLAGVSAGIDNGH